MDHLAKVSNSKVSFVFSTIFFVFICALLVKLGMANHEISESVKGLMTILFGISGRGLISHTAITDYVGEKPQQLLALVFRVILFAGAAWVIYIGYMAYPQLTL